jgi:hypothetical protein
MPSRAARALARWMSRWTGPMSQVRSTLHCAGIWGNSGRVAGLPCRRAMVVVEPRPTVPVLLPCVQMSQQTARPRHLPGRAAARARRARAAGDGVALHRDCNRKQNCSLEPGVFGMSASWVVILCAAIQAQHSSCSTSKLLCAAAQPAAAGGWSPACPSKGPSSSLHARCSACRSTAYSLGDPASCVC